MKEIDHRRADLNLLVVFQKLLVERHVGRAAKRLGLTQSAASHALGQLRIMFGDPLFVRHPKGIEPTSRAHALAPIVVDILDRANSMLASPGWFDPSKPHTFTIGGTDLAVFTVLVPLIKRLRATAPKSRPAGSVAGQYSRCRRLRSPRDRLRASAVSGGPSSDHARTCHQGEFCGNRAPWTSGLQA